MPKSKRLPGGKEVVGGDEDKKKAFDPDIEEIEFPVSEEIPDAPAEEVGQDITQEDAQARRDAMKAKKPATNAEYDGTLYVRRQEEFKAEPFEDGQIAVSLAHEDSESMVMSQKDFNDRFEALDSTPKTPRWKIQITSPDKVQRSLWNAKGPDPAKIYKYVETHYDDTKENPIPDIPGVMISGPAY